MIAVSEYIHEVSPDEVPLSIRNAILKKDSAADTTITILGTSGCGKTCYLLSMYHKMCSGMKGFTLTADDDVDVDLRNRYKRMTDRSLGDARFPLGTDSRERYDFTLEYGYEPIMSFSWDDYPGQVLDDKSTGDIEMFSEVEKSIIKSSCLFICIDGELLCDDDFDEKIENIQDDCSIIINNFISRYKKKHRHLPPTAFVITKWDICQGYTNEDELKELLKETFTPFFDVGSTTAIIPVSIDTKNGTSNTSERLHPYQIQLPIYMGIYLALQDRIAVLQKKQKKMDSERANESNSFFIFRNDKKIAQLEQSIDQIQEDIKIKTRNLYNLIAELDKYNVPLFVDGEQRSFLQ